MKHRELLTIEALPTETIHALIERADQFARGGHLRDRSLLAGKVMVPMFYEPSTRTRCSFEIAAKRLGMDVIYFDADVSSVTKGESLWDTMMTLQAMGVDVAVLRHQEDDVYDTLYGRLNMGLVNAGNGTMAHPTQALLDWLTMRQTFGRLDGLQVAIVGDVRHSRVARSHIAGLARLGAQPLVSGPPYFRDRGMEQLAPYVPFTEAVREADVLMLLRIQRERLEADLAWDIEEYLWEYGMTPKRMEQMKSGSVIMHPGPVNRGIEIDPSLVEHERSLINQQVCNGVYVRMAVLEHILTEGANYDDLNSTSHLFSVR